MTVFVGVEAEDTATYPYPATVQTSDPILSVQPSSPALTPLPEKAGAVAGSLKETR